MKLRLSIAVALIYSTTTSSFAADSLEAAFSKGKVSGNLQAWYINDSFQAGTGTAAQTTRGGAANPVARGESAVGGILSYVTDPYYGINAGTTFVSSNLLGQNTNAGNTSGNYSGTNSSVVSSINYNVNTLSEAYIQGVYGKTSAKIGEQKLVTPLADSNDGARIFYNTFRAGVLANSDIPDTTILAAYINGMQTRSTSSYYPGTTYGSTGTQAVQASVNTGFQGMDYVAFGDAANAVTGGNNNPVWAAAAINKSISGLTAQAWFYQAVNVLNALYLQGDYKYNFNQDTSLFAGAQYLYEGGTGNTQNSFKNGVATQNGANISLASYCNGQSGQTSCSSGLLSNYFAFKLGGTYENLTLTAAYSTTSYNANAGLDGSLIMPWGGATTTLFTSSMIGNATAGGTQATQWKAEYSFDGILKGLYACASYTLYAAKSAAQDAFTNGNPFGYNATSAIGGNQGYSSAYGEIKYDFNAQTQVRWRVENDSMIGQANGLPKAAFESRLMGIYKF